MKNPDKQKPQDEGSKAVSSLTQHPVCGICENEMSDLCDNCQIRGEREKYPCTVSSGECGHAYHTHCIQSWRKMFKMCITCKKDWVHSVTVKRK